MFDPSNQDAQIAPRIDELPCQIRLPEAWLEQYSSETNAVDGDQRRFPRHPCGSPQAKAALEYRSTLPSRPREPTVWAVYPVSISRGGLAFLHSEPLYPCEKFRISLPNGKAFEIEVARCRRVGDRCFEVGARF